MEFRSAVAMDIPASAVDVEQWLLNLSDSAYRACAGGHLAMGTFRDDQGIGMVNVETIGGVLLIQPYRINEIDRGHFVLLSDKTSAYVLHLVPLTVKVRWSIRVAPATATSATLICEIGTYFNSPITAALADLMGLRFFLRRHLVEETRGFARDLQRHTALTGARSVNSASYE
jgi:hypothetical protein